MGVEVVLGHKIKNYANFKDEVPCNIKADSSESKETSTKTDEISPCERIPRARRFITRKDGSRTDIHYGIKSTQARLRSYYDFEKYCSTNNSFDFSGKNKFSGIASDMDINLLEQPEASQVEIYIPQNYRKCFKSPQVKEWHSAMKEEITVMEEREVWNLLHHPKNKKILCNSCVYTIKKN
ncbi:retrovirus-related Pol polyprotein from transposon TNT 1-94 [Trichonephila clavipes]|nr:retrovirus-related Pol polyprotein from transposon TNT 1-94 [Trichonephila clavipes]